MEICGSYQSPLKWKTPSSAQEVQSESKRRRLEEVEVHAALKSKDGGSIIGKEQILTGIVPVADDNALLMDIQAVILADLFKGLKIWRNSLSQWQNFEDMIIVVAWWDTEQRNASDILAANNTRNIFGEFEWSKCQRGRKLTEDDWFVKISEENERFP